MCIDSRRAEEALDRNIEERRKAAAHHKSSPIWLLAIMTLAGCQSLQTSVKIEPDELRSAYKQYSRSILSDEHLSRHSAQVLNLVPEARGASDLEQQLAALEASPRIDNRDRLLALAELALAAALRAGDKPNTRSRGLYLLAAFYSHRLLFEETAPSAGNPFDQRVQLAVGVFNLASGRYFLRLMALGREWTGDLDETIFGKRFGIGFADTESVLAAYYFDTFELTWVHRVVGLRNHYYRDGVGVPLIAYRRNRLEQPLERFFQREGIVAPMTVVLRFSTQADAAGDRYSARLALYDARRVEFVCLGPQAQTLAADFTAPYAYLLAQTRLRALGREGLFDATSADEQRGIFLTEAYDPGKIPILMIHGVASSPLAWRELTNDILGSDELRHRYQIWHYLYPTGVPWLASARIMRSDLRVLLDEFDPRREGKPIIVIGHSMGGLLAKTLVVHSGASLWDTVFTVAPADLDAEPAVRQTFEEALFLDPWPEVGRVIFMGTPHQGSARSGSFLGRTVDGFIRVPRDLRDLVVGASSRSPDQIRPEMRDYFRRGGLSSIDALAPQYPLIRSFAALSIDARVPFHSIIGTALTEGAGERSDGFVTFSSAHLPGAASELSVAVKHRQLDHAAALNEVYRILRLHAADSGMAAPMAPENPRAVDCRPSGLMD